VTFLQAVSCKSTADTACGTGDEVVHRKSPRTHPYCRSESVEA
jgi:hypothetical protein